MKPTFQVRPHTSLGIQLLVLGIGALLFLAMAFTVFNTYSQREELERVFTRQASALAFNLAVSSSSHMLEKDYSVIETLLIKTEGFQDLYSATVADDQGKVLAHALRDPDGQHLTMRYEATHLWLVTPVQNKAEGKTRLLRSDRFLTVVEPVEAGQRIGMVVLEFDLTPLQQRQWELIRRNVLLALALILPATLALWLFIRKTLVELNSLTHFAQQMVEHQGVEHGPVPTSRELAQLHATLNWASTTLLKNNKALEEAKIKADKSNDLKSQFVANMSHEIRTPLNGILGLTDITLGIGNLPEKPRRNLELIQLSAEHLLRVVNDILDFSKIDANRLDIDPQPFPLREHVKAVVNMVSSAYAKPQVAVLLDIAPDVPFFFLGDSPRIMQVLNNLLSNALKFTHKGQVSLTISREGGAEGQQEESTCLLHFSVRDTGMGISEAARSEIFKAFSQAEPGTARKYGGTGLGLTITQRLLELMNSRIHLWSEEGLGSEFSFTLQLPVVEQNQATEHLPTFINMTHTDPGHEQAEFGKATTPLRVLVAEDNMVNQTFISHVLTQLGISYRFADDGLAAVQAVEEETFDLVFMDMHMPNMGGLEACRKILADPRHRDLPIVGLTADAIADTREACMSAGMREYISKPFKRNDIEAVLAKLQFKVSPIPMQNFDHDRELLKTTIDMISADIPKLDQRINHQLQEGDLAEAKRTLHILKGHCKLIGEMAFAEFMQYLENLLLQGRKPSIDAINHLNNNLQVLLQRLRQLSR
ncbi:MAG TPA: response regulator [Limnobacter sp.]|nr:response regulator [Limnobacter sp.]